MGEPLDFTFTIAKLDIHPGDTVVFRLSRPFTLVVVEAFQAYLQANLPQGVKALVVDRDTEVVVLSTPDDQVHAFCDGDDSH